MIEKKKKVNIYSFKAQLIITFVVLIVVPVSVLGIYSYFLSKNNLIEQTEVAMRGSSDVITYGIENNAKRENDVIKFFSYEENFRSKLEYAQEDPFAITEELTENIEPLIWYFMGSDMSIESINFYSKLLGSDHIGEFLSRPTDEKIEEWYQLCEKEYGAQWVTDGEGGIYIIKALLDVSSSSKVIGIVVLKVNNEFFFSITNQSSYLNNGIVITDESGAVITEKKIKNEKLNNEIKDTIFSGFFKDDTEQFLTTNEYFLMAAAKMANGWRLFYYVDRAEIVADVRSLLTSVVLIAAIIFIIAIIIATTFSNRTSRRVSKLNEAANLVRNGNFDIAIQDDGRDEIAELAESMEDMASKLKYMVDEINLRNQEDLLVKESDIHYREWLFDFVVEKNNDILAVVNEEDFSCNFLTSNAESILGISMEDMKDDIRVLTKAQREGKEERLKDIIEDCNKKGAARVIDEIRFENVKTGEHLYYRGAVICTIDDGGKRMAIALYDITQEIRRNHQLQEALNAAETANKAKTSFLANMSHDFRTPMNAITGFNLLIDKHAEEPDKVKEYTHKISLASQNLLSLLNDVLDMSKIESGKTTLDIKEVAIGLLLEEINSVISFQAKAKNQEYIVRIEEMEHDTFMGDKQRINEILMNILGNAIKYTPEGGKIEFLINESPSSSEGFQNVRFTIRDNGIGMKPEYKDKIFDAFTREDKGATKGIQGTGLGMAITKSLVELMGGTIRVESEEGKGSTFIVNLRLKAVDEKDVGFWKAHGISCVMLVAERPEYYEQIRTALEADNVEILESKTGFEAVHVIENCNSAEKLIDLILIDSEVEAMSAAEIVGMVRSKDRRNNSLVLVMADSYEDVEDELKKAGANDILPKPVFISTLKQIVEDMTSRASAKETKEEKNPLEGMKFLAAEDNDINADILTELMSMEGATVTRGVNGQEVVEMFKEAKEGDYDMILMDIQMPVMNGYEAAAAIRAIPTDWAQRIPIIAMTANAYADDVQQAFDAGMNAHVSKPIDIKVVEKTILEFKK